jgi:glycosyltransferase involved in cell wall biosynthesis
VSGKRVLVFTETALALSETFIAAHCRSLRDFNYTLVALNSSGEHHPDVPRTLLFPDSRPDPLSRLAFRLGQSRRLDALIRTIKPDIIHAHYLTNGAFLMPYAARLGIPLVATAHGHDAVRPLRINSVYDQLYRRQRRLLMRNAALVLPVSNFLRGKLVSAGSPAGRILTHYLGIEAPLHPPRDVSTNAPRIVFVGRLVAKKGLDAVLRAFAIVRSTRLDAELHIVGDGPLRHLIRSATAELRGVVWHGAQLPGRTQQIIAGARLLTLPSRPADDGDVEGLGLVLIEAQALGVPVVTSNMGGTLEAIRPGETGLAVDPMDHAALAQAFLTLLNNDSVAQIMGKKAYLWARQRFDINTQTRSLEQLYTSVLDHAAPARMRI